MGKCALEFIQMIQVSQSKEVAVKVSMHFQRNFNMDTIRSNKIIERLLVKVVRQDTKANRLKEEEQPMPVPTGWLATVHELAADLNILYPEQKIRAPNSN